MRQVEQYYDIVHRHTPETALIGLTTINGTYVSNRFFMKRYLGKLIQTVDSIGTKSNVYTRLTPMNKAPESGRGLATASIGTSVLWLDYDTYKNQIDGLRALNARQLPPTLVVNSGNGLHAYWLLDRLYTDLDAIKARNKQLALDFGGKDEGGDSCFDLARVLRVPETFNVKTADPLEVSIVSYEPTRIYTLDQFDAADLTNDVTIDVWDCEALPGDFIETVREKDAKLAKRILTEEGARKVDAPTNASGGIDRSRNDAYIATRLLALGYPPSICLSVLMANDWFSGSRYNERKRYDYVVMTVNAAVCAYENSPDRYFSKTTFVTDKMATELQAHGQYIYTAEQLWRYVGGVFRNDGKDFVRAHIVQRLGYRWSSRAADETVTYLEDKTAIPLARINQHEGLINCRNGMLDIVSGALLPHDPKYLSTVQIPADYDASADPSAVDKFLAEVLPRDAIVLFWQYVGSAFLTGRYTPKAFLTLVGPTDSGKSQVLGLLVRFFGGDQNVSALSIQTLADNKFATAELFGKIANIFSDLDEGEAQNVGQLKTLTGGDPISGEQKFKGFFMFKNTARVFFSSNDYPAVRNPDAAYFNRAHILPCNHHFGPHNADPFIVDKLSTPAHLSAMLLRATQGLRSLIANDYVLSTSASVEDANATYRFTADTVSGFLNRCEADQSFVISKEQFYQLYRAACRSANRKDVSQDKFFKRVADNLARFGMAEEYKTMDNGKGQWCYTGRKPATLENVLVMPADWATN